MMRFACGLVGPQERLDPAAQFGVRAALALQVGGTLGRIGEVECAQEQRFCARGVGSHGSPLETRMKDEG